MYSFDGLEKNLQKKTFAREEKAREVAGLTMEMGRELSGLNTKFTAYYEVYQKETDEAKKQEWLDKIMKVNDESLAMKEKMEWKNDFDKCIAVMNVLLVEGADGLTKDNFCGDDAEVVWQDFFTQKNSIKSNKSVGK